MPSVAMYLMDLRGARRLSRARLADLVGTTEMTILRIETQGQEPGGGLLVRLVAALGGSWDAVTRLVLAPEDSADLVRDLVAEEQARPAGAPAEEAQFNRLLDLLESGVPPDEAARRARRGQ